MPTHYLLTGEVDSGKTSFLWTLLKDLRRRFPSFTPGGVLTPAVFFEGKKIAYRIHDLLTGQHTIFALHARGQTGHHLIRCGNWLILPPALDFGRHAIRNSLHRKLDLLIVDEIGPLELEGHGYFDLLEPVFSSQHHLLLVVRRSILHQFQALFPQQGFTAIELKPGCPWQPLLLQFYKDWVHLDRDEE